MDRGTARERVLRDNLPALSQRILDLAKDQGRIAIGQVVQLTGANRTAVKRPSLRPGD